VAKKIKDYYDVECAKLIAEKFKKAYPSFDSKKFVLDVDSKISSLEFSKRVEVFALSLQQQLPPDWSKCCKLILKILGPELSESKGMFIYGWWLWPIGKLIEINANRSPNDSLDLIYELTKRFTGEFAIRPLLEKNPKITLKEMVKWSKDKNVHVRRLSSEGIRISLPWAKKLLVFVEHFDICEKILTSLKDDSDMFVKKSVGNNLNDLYKYDPKLANKIISNWKNSTPSNHTLWIIQHGLRSTRNKKS
jgi:3-methyladenine DNA glycosylase AlkC